MRFRFNGWGEKYELPWRRRRGRAVQALERPTMALRARSCCEGGARRERWRGPVHDHARRGAQPQPQPRPERRRTSKSVLDDALGAERVIWLKRRPAQRSHRRAHRQHRALHRARAACCACAPTSATIPIARCSREIERELRKQGLEVVTLPSPGLVLGRDGAPLPASYLNFYIANSSVVVPMFGSRARRSGARGARGAVSRAHRDRRARQGACSRRAARFTASRSKSPASGHEVTS